MLDETSSSVVLSPHLDDAALSCWSVLSETKATVVNVFAGVPAPGVVGEWDRVVGSTDGASLVAMRRREDRVALHELGCQAVYLDFLESQYRDGDSVEDIVATIRNALGDATEIVVPAGIGGHPDHLQVRAAALRIAAASCLPLRLYAELPYAAAFGWPAWVTGMPANGRLDIDAYWDLFLAEEFGNWRSLNCDIRRLDDQDHRTKLACLERYETQFALLNGGPLERLRNPAITGFEALLTLVPETLSANTFEQTQSLLGRFLRRQDERI
ncbi:MAG: PIG-L family deacetylase [Gaiellaceae bacterium]